MKNLSKKYENKKIYLYGGILVIVFLIAGVGIWYTMEQNHKKEVLESISISFKENVHIEYGAKEIDYDSFIDEKIGEPEIVFPTEQINTKELGKKELKYELKKDGYSKELILDIEIKDTEIPVITFKEDSVLLDYGSDFNITDNVESVSDPVDGAIPYLTTEEVETKTAGLAENETLKGYYTVTGEVNTSSANDYTVTIKAIDSNGNEETKEYTVTVQEEVVAEQPQQPSYNGGSYSNGYTAPSGGSSTSNNGGSASGGSSSSSGGVTCDRNNQFKTIGNSGIAGYDSSVVLSQAEPKCPDGYKTIVTATNDTCGNGGWTASYRPR